jgi:hypothetical protein
MYENPKTLKLIHQNIQNEIRYMLFLFQMGTLFKANFLVIFHVMNATIS